MFHVRLHLKMLFEVFNFNLGVGQAFLDIFDRQFYGNYFSFNFKS